MIHNINKYQQLITNNLFIVNKLLSIKDIWT